MRETGVVRRRAVGDPDLAAPYFGLARTLLGRLKNKLGAGVAGTHTWLLPDGVQIRTTTGPQGDAVEVDVERVGGEPPGCKPLDPALTGLTVTRLSNVVVLDPTGNDESPYTVYVKDKATADAFGTLTPKNYAKRTIDTCGKREDWYTSSLIVGNTSWFGGSLNGAPVVLSWNGYQLRYGGGSTGLARGKAVYYRGRTVSAFSADGESLVALGSSSAHFSTFPNGSDCTGVALRRNEDGKLYMVYALAHVNTGAGFKIVEERIFLLPVVDMTSQVLVVDASVTAAVQIMAESALYVSASNGCQAVPWLFNKSGTRAVTARRLPDVTYNHYQRRMFLDVADAVAIQTLDEYVHTQEQTSSQVNTENFATYSGFFCGPPPVSSKDVVTDSSSVSASLTTDYYKFSDFVGDELVELVMSETVETSETRNYTAIYEYTDSDPCDALVRTSETLSANSSRTVTIEVDGAVVATGITTAAGSRTGTASGTDDGDFPENGTYSRTVSGYALGDIAFLYMDLRARFCLIMFNQTDVEHTDSGTWAWDGTFQNIILTPGASPTQDVSLVAKALRTALIGTLPAAELLSQAFSVSATVELPSASILYPPSGTLNSSNTVPLAPANAVPGLPGDETLISRLASEPGGHVVLDIIVPNTSPDAFLQYLDRVADISVFLERPSGTRYNPVGCI